MIYPLPMFLIALTQISILIFIRKDLVVHHHLIPGAFMLVVFIRTKYLDEGDNES